MSHTLTEATSFAASVTVPDPGELVTANSVIVPLQAVTDRTKFLRSKIGALTVARPVPSIPSYVATYWDRAGGVLNNAVVTKAGNTGNTTTMTAIWALGFLPHGATIISFDIAMQGAPGHAGLFSALGSKPAARLYSEAFTTATVVEEATLVHAATTYGVYEAFHIMGSPAISVAVDRNTKSYWIAFENESGANSIEAGLTLWGARVGYTLPADHDAGGIT